MFLITNHSRLVKTGRHTKAGQEEPLLMDLFRCYFLCGRGLAETPGLFSVDTTRDYLLRIIMFWEVLGRLVGLVNMFD